MPFNTRNPIPSGDLRDLDDNARNIDTWANDKTKLSHPDRFGVQRRTWHGIEQEANLNIQQAIDAKNAAQEAAMMSGFSKYADTLAQLEAGIGTDYVEGDVVMVFQDESRGDTSSIFKIESGAAEFKLTFDKTRQDLLSFTGVISADAEWSDVPAHSDPAFDAQAQALANRTEIIKSSSAATAEALDQFAADIASEDGALKGARMVGHRGRTVADKLDEALSLADMGGVADYTGTPLYDGDDASRITASDNTAAFEALITEALERGESVVRIPAGHWGVKMGNLAFSNFDKLRIFGDGIGVTIVDFIKEDATRVAYVDNASDPHVIASFETGNSIEFADMTIKATTKGGVVNGTSGPSNSAAVYYGAVWGFKINNVADVRFTRVRVERFNYRGFSVYGAETKRVTMLHCEGFHNVGSGFWVENAEVFKVIGGEFAFNGIAGEVGTGYGVTGSTGIHKMLVLGGYYHHNYRKGLDTHGVKHFKAVGGIYQTNIFSHIDVLRYSADPAGGTTVISDCLFEAGVDDDDQQWILDVYNQRKVNGYSTAGGHVFRVVDVAAGKSASTQIIGNIVRSHFCPHATAGFTSSQPPFQISTADGSLEWIDNNVNLDGFQFAATGLFIEHCLLDLVATNYLIRGGYLRCLADGTFTNTHTSATDNANVFILRSVNSITSRISFENWKLSVNNLFFTSGALATGSGGIRSNINWSNTERVMVNVDLEWQAEPFSAVDPTNKFNTYNFLGYIPPSPPPAKLVQYRNRNVISGGAAYTISDYGISPI